MEMIRWHRGWQEIAIRSGWWPVRATSPAPDDAEWIEVPAADTREARRLLGHDQAALQAMRRLLGEDGVYNVIRLNDHQVRDQVAQRLASRHWLLLWRASVSRRASSQVHADQMVPVRSSVPAPSAPAPSVPAGARRQGTPPSAGRRPTSLPPQTSPELSVPGVGHWIEIALIGEDDCPIAGVAYVVALPDGSRRSGLLDRHGCARIDDLPTAGPCKVSFPALDRDAWDFAAASRPPGATSARAGATP